MGVKSKASFLNPYCFTVYTYTERWQGNVKLSPLIHLRFVKRKSIFRLTFKTFDKIFLTTEVTIGKIDMFRRFMHNVLKFRKMLKI